MPARSHFHANMFNIAMVDDIEDASSRHRMNRAAQLMPARTRQQAVEILGDL